MSDRPADSQDDPSTQSAQDDGVYLLNMLRCPNRYFFNVFFIVFKSILI